jgi:phosphatidylglycerophosphatase A
MSNFKTKAALAVASGAGTGFFPFASGTFASAIYVILYAAVFQFFNLTIEFDLLILALLSIGGWLATYLCIKEGWHLKLGKAKLSMHKNHDTDASFIVIDEWAGMQVTLLALLTPKITLLFLAFLFFRLFDITKPQPVAWLEKLPGALGVMADDLMAGIYAAISLLACTSILEYSGMLAKLP